MQDQEKNEIFYTVGRPILLTKKSIFSWFKLFNEPDRPNYRDDITEKEVINSLIEKDELLLFENKAEALAYSRSGRDGEPFKNDEIWQPAVFTIKYLEGLAEQKAQSRKISINQRGSKTPSLPFDQRQRVYDVSYYEVPNNHQSYGVMSATLNLDEREEQENTLFKSEDISFTPDKGLRP